MKTFIKKILGIPHLFSKLIVAYCVAFASGASYYALRILSRTGHDASTLLGVILAFFGGELMLLCLKAILKNERKDGTSDD
ncbi:MAG: hypothetical protein IKU94_00655 [Bacteroidaceae bacterium]|nr:hypothetical protein [Bacteroidaceae bacterium]MBR4930453.1 hypothetical protein [Bacteroidaceae bacterium]